jgi:hypothetical protein
MGWPDNILMAYSGVWAICLLALVGLGRLAYRVTVKKTVPEKDPEADTVEFPALAHGAEPGRSPWQRPVVYNYPMEWP